jgi:glycoprotein endo-alpha-1,2-mannosidase
LRTRWFPTAAAALAVLAVLALAAADSSVAGPAASSGQGVGEVAIFYYPWYGTPAVDGAWEHWQQNGNVPPTQIAAGWYPARGPYSSSDTTVVREQMREIASAGIGTVIVSWWGPGSREAARLPLIEKLASSLGLRVAIHVEPFGGRTPAGLAPQIRELARKGVTAFYIYDSTTSADSEWRALNGQLPAGVRLYANTGLPGKAEAGGFAGLYTYDVRVYDGTSFSRMCASARLLNLLCAPSVGPGFDAVRATGETRVSNRADGATYDRMWRNAVRAGADAVTITSYNEWHEGTQIEPARQAGARYASYDGAYGLVGNAARRAYLDRTAYWVKRYWARLGSWDVITPFSLGVVLLQPRSR